MAFMDNLGNVLVPTTGADNGILQGDDQTLDLLGGNDLVDIIGDNNTVNGDEGNDVLDSTEGTGNTLNGNSGNDTLFGGIDGIIDGGTGRDVIYAAPNGNGGSTISGGEGRDIVLIATAELPTSANTITGFKPSLDYIGVSLSPNLKEFTDLDITEANGNTTISLDGTDIAILEGVAADDLTPVTRDAEGNILSGNVAVVEGEIVLPPLPNAAPTITADQSFSYGQLGTVQAVDPDQDELTYAITDGNAEGYFAINPLTGALTLTDTAPTEATAATLTIAVSDGIAAPVTGTVEITDVVSTFSLDVDGDSTASEATDALLINQYLTTKTFGVTLSDDDIAGLFDPTGDRITAAAITGYLDPFYNDLTSGGLDVDGDSTASEATDALLINQYLTTKTFGVTLGDDDIAGLFDPAGDRITAAAITTFLDPFYPAAA